MHRRIRLVGTALSSLLLLSIVGCGSDAPVAEAPKASASAPAPVASASVVATPSASSPAEPAMPPVELVAGAHAPAPAKAPKIRFVAPKADEVVPADKATDYEVKLDLQGWDVPAGGNHVHVLLDGQPYKRIDDAKAPIKLRDVAPKATLSEGQHVLVAFPSRPTHESVKPIGKDAPLAVVSFWVGKKGTASWKSSDPTFVFSRPKGANDGAPPTEGLLIDWYQANVELGEGKHSIAMTLRGPGIDGEAKATIREWTPWRIRNPRDGEYQLRMSLLDKDGKQVPGTWNDVTRSFTVDTKAPSNAHAGHSPSATAASTNGAPATGSAASSPKAPDAGHAGHSGHAPASATPSAAPAAK
jgi:hypothetical protein